MLKPIFNRVTQSIWKPAIINSSFGLDIAVRSNDYLTFDGVMSFAGAANDIVTGSGDTVSILFNTLSLDTSTDSEIIGNKLLTEPGYGGYVLLYLDAPDGMTVIITDDAEGFTRYTLGGLNEIVNGEFNRVEVVITPTECQLYINNSLFNTTPRLESRDITLPVSEANGGIFGGSGRYCDGVFGDFIVKVNDAEVMNCAFDQKGSDIQTNKADVTNPVTLYNVNHSTDWFENVEGKLLGYERLPESLLDWDTYGAPTDITNDSFNAPSAGNGFSVPGFGDSRYVLTADVSSVNAWTLQMFGSSTVYLHGNGSTVFDSLSDRLLWRADGSGEYTKNSISCREYLGDIS